MLWRRSSQTTSVLPAGPVPDAEVLRRAALQASWQRDRWVARRRVWFRWIVWVSGRFVLPAVLVLGVGAWLWLDVLPSVGNPLERLATAATSAPKTPEPAAPEPTASAQPAQPKATTPAREPDPTEDALRTPLPLKFETQWAAGANSARRSAPTTDGPAPPTPNLKPENWLHSKEP